MKNIPLKRLLLVMLAFVLLAAACGGDDDASSDDAAAEDATETTEAAADSADGGESSAAGSLAEVCPATMIIQTDWNPEAEHGALYQMVGAGYSIDNEVKSVTGPLVAGGEETGIDIEIRVGGPAIGFQQVVAQMYQDTSITMGYLGTTEQAQNYADFPTKVVVAPLEINPQIIMWDPETYPDVETIADLGAEGITIRHFGGSVYTEVFKDQGIWSDEQLDGSYDGRPAVFVAEEGKIAQQGFASAEPYIYKNEVPEWGKDVKYQLLHDAGYQIYAAALGVRDAVFDELSPCLEKFVPIVQQAQVDYVNSPGVANELILELVETYDTGWVYSAGVAEYSVATQLADGLVGNGDDATLGNFDEARIASVLDQMRDLEGFDVPADLSASDLFTNEFVDASIGL